MKLFATPMRIAQLIILTEWGSSVVVWDIAIGNNEPNCRKIKSLSFPNSIFL